MRCYLVLVATSGIQKYIFDTNKRRENVGASYLAASVGKWTAAALTAMAREGELEPGWTRNSCIPATLTGGERAAEIVVRAAGSATVVVTDEAAARALIARVTRTALVEAPGLDVCGAFVPFEWYEDGAAAEANKSVRLRVAHAKSMRPGPEMRFLRLPLIDRCTSSGLPASKLCSESPVSVSVRPDVRSDVRPDGARTSGRTQETVPRSRPSASKLAAADSGYGRLAAVTVGLPTEPANDGLPTGSAKERERQARVRKAARDGVEAVADYLERRADWVAVVHADGNNLGEAINQLRQRLPDATSRTFIDALRRFSESLERASGLAYREAVAELDDDPAVPRVRRPGPDARRCAPVLPLVLGGDDLTVVCDGKAALGFTVAYLKAFEKHTSRELDPEHADPLTACAGVAIVKAHYPFSSAYDLAEELTLEAKQVKRRVGGPASALSFHVLHDSTAIVLEELRARQTVDAAGAIRVVAQPYVVTCEENDWTRRRRWDDLLRRVAALRAETRPLRADDGRTGRRDAVRLLPRSQTHVLRDALHGGRLAADSQFALLRHRYGRRGLDALAPSGSLFWEHPPGRWQTGLLDAMEAEPFLGSLSGGVTTEADESSLEGVAR